MHARSEEVDRHERGLAEGLAFRVPPVGTVASQSHPNWDDCASQPRFRLPDIVASQIMRRFSTITQRRTRVKVFGVVIPSPVVVATE